MGRHVGSQFDTSWAEIASIALAIEINEVASIAPAIEINESGTSLLSPGL